MSPSLKGIVKLTIASLVLIITLPLISEDLKVGSRAPDFRLPVALSDSTISLSDFIDKKIVIVHFWKSR